MHDPMRDEMDDQEKVERGLICPHCGHSPHGTNRCKVRHSHGPLYGEPCNCNGRNASGSR